MSNPIEGAYREGYARGRSDVLSELRDRDLIEKSTQTAEDEAWRESATKCAQDNEEKA